MACWDSSPAEGDCAAAEAKEGDAALLKDAQSVFSPLPKDMATAKYPFTPELVSLGRKLFFDPRVSVDGTVSCSRCHQPALYGIDSLPKSRGAHDNLLPRNAPTVFNAAIQFKAHWDGANDDVEMQARRSLTGPGLGNPDNASGMAKLQAIPGYRELFAKAFPGPGDPITVDHFAMAIGAYERTLVSPARFDDYLRGQTDALSEPERQGLRKFMATGCADCHTGSDVGGTMFQKFGVVEDYWKKTGSQEVDKGRFDLTKDAADMYVFKVPSLRNVEMTPAYFHDGTVATLPEAVQIMAQVQLGATLPEEDVESIVAYLKSLTGTIPAEFQEAPVLPTAGFGVTPATGGVGKAR